MQKQLLRLCFIVILGCCVVPSHAATEAKPVITYEVEKNDAIAQAIAEAFQKAYKHDIMFASLSDQSPKSAFPP